MKLRKGKTKNILESSINAALLAVEIYNKPRTTFRSQAYIVLMIIAWTRLFHAYYNETIGDKYYYKESDGHHKSINGDRKAWELTTCINKYKELSEPVKTNLKFFIALRNKIEHKYITEREIDNIIFGECQSLLYNYENLLIEFFGEEYALNENLSFSLQFSSMRTDEQKQANKKVLSAEAREIKSYIDNYRTTLIDDIYNSQEFSIKLIQIPKVSNTNRHDLAIEFVREDELDPDMLESITTIIKEKRVLVEAKNVGELRARMVIKKVKEKTTNINFNQHHHTWLYSLFEVRPPTNDPNPDLTKTEYCHYDRAHKDYLYKESWVDFIVNLFEEHHLTIEDIRQAFRADEKWDINQYL